MRIRCRQVARALGCDYLLGGPAPHAIPPGKDVFVLVKWGGDRAALRRRGVVIWDVIDGLPPVDGVDKYVYSTAAARGVPPAPCRPRARRGHPAPPLQRRRADANGDRILWIGGIEWLPRLAGSGVTIVDSTGLSTGELAEAYRSARVLVNLRRVERPQDLLHCRLA
ncbi:MAG: hypothetical protein IPF73_13215, partial [Betaproteobacteria bacterium]|nr:hypothetical protein [Betaproteobacteria bacterium]